MLENCRKNIDDIDAQLVNLLEARMVEVRAVGAYKQKHQMAVTDAGREEALLKGLKGRLKDSAHWGAVAQVYETILAVSRAAQTELATAAPAALAPVALATAAPAAKAPVALATAAPAALAPVALATAAPVVAYFGQPGSYTHEALGQYFPPGTAELAQPTFEAVAEAVISGSCRYGILPIENSSTGSIHPVYDLLGRMPLQIVGEIRCPIEHYLLVKPGTAREAIRTVYSHAQALSQCQRYLSQNGFVGVAVASSSKGAQLAASGGGGVLAAGAAGAVAADAAGAVAAGAAGAEAADTAGACAAIGSRQAARCHNLDVLEGPLCDYGQNQTRFIVFEAVNQIQPSGLGGAGTVIGLSFQIPHLSGSLLKILEIFYEQNLNLLKIESRPIGEKPFEYQFYVDFEGQMDTRAVQTTLEKLKGQTLWLKVLGTWEKSA